MKQKAKYQVVETYRYAIRTLNQTDMITLILEL